MKANSDIVKQRSTEWFEMRKKVKVTGSTLHAALGLENLAEMKQHHYQFVKKRAKPPFTEEVKMRLKYGQENEKNALATVIGGLICAYKPRCFFFQEVGSVYIQAHNEEDFMLVSPDGILRCMNGENCPEDNNLEEHCLIPIGAKCVFPDNTKPLQKPLQPMYTLPPRYVPQCLNEMAAYGSKTLWFVSFTATSQTLLSVKFDTELWKKMLEIAYELHGGEKPKVPVKLHPETKNLKALIKEFTEKKCTFICEVPSFRGVEGPLRESSFLSPHSFCEVRRDVPVVFPDLERLSKVITFDCIPLFEFIHNTLRQEAQEVLVFMLSDHNRHHEEFLPYSVPLGYAMKGKSLSNRELRYLINTTRNELSRRGIPVLCEVYDGQWQNLCMQSDTGLPLTQLRLIKNTWQRIMRLSKEKCLELLILAAKVKATDLERMMGEERLDGEIKTFYNIELKRESDGSLCVQSRGGATFSEPAIAYIRTVTERSRPDLWKENAEIVAECRVEKKRSRTVQVGLKDDEKSLAHLLDREIVEEIKNELGEELILVEEEVHITEKDFSQFVLTLALKHSDVSLLKDIVCDLQEHNERKWINLTSETLYPGLLTNTVRLNKECNVTHYVYITLNTKGKEYTLNNKQLIQ